LEKSGVASAIIGARSPGELQEALKVLQGEDGGEGFEEVNRHGPSDIVGAQVLAN
jgi:aryl-alcohol dehydrogenase-like predicted oxidoreductase